VRFRRGGGRNWGEGGGVNSYQEGEKNQELSRERGGKGSGVNRERNGRGITVFGSLYQLK